MMLDASTQPGHFGRFVVRRRLGDGGMGVVYLAEDPRTRREVAVKTVAVPHADLLSGIRREIHALLRLQHPGIVEVVADGVTAGLPWYAMEVVDGVSLRAFVSELWPPAGVTRPTSPTPMAVSAQRPAAAAGRLVEVLERFGALCEPLAHLHGHGLVHRDLNPDNVMLRADGTPVLVDFGLATSFDTDEGRESLAPDSGIAGTILYTAPEQLRGEYVDARADLYSLGCMLYEALTGAPPFTGTFTEVTHRQLHADPPPPSSRADGVPPKLDMLVLRLLSKRPADRIGFADYVGARLLELAGREARHDRRHQAYLYRPGLAGREAAVNSLDEQLQRLGSGRGGCRVLCGESGIGKTRLLLAAASMAQHRQVRVFGGACSALSASAERTTGAAPLEAFRSVLQALLDACRGAGRARLDHLIGSRAPVLALHDAAFAALPGVERYPAAPPLPPEAAESRFVESFAETVARFVEDAPTLLVLDDLQWADSVTLAVLDRLAVRAAQGLPLAVVASCRVEETSRPVERFLEREHVSKVPVDRLDAAAVGAIIRGTLAWNHAPAGLRDFLAAQSEGNPFFVVEYLRAAVAEGVLYRDDHARWQASTRGDSDEASAFEALGLPTTLRALVERRLAALSRGGRELLEMAAVYGARLDDAFLMAATRLEEDAYVTLLDELVRRQLLEPAGARGLAFTHSKLREGAYQGLDEARRHGLHLRAGETIERLTSRGTRSAEVLEQLAHHFGQAKDISRTLRYAELAGDQALRKGANQSAAGHFERLLSLAHHADPSTPRGRRRVAEWRRCLGEACFGLGVVDRAQVQLEEVFSHLGRPLPEDDGGWKRLMAAESAQQLGRVVLPDKALRLLRAARPAELLVAARAAQRLSHVYYYTGETLKQMAVTFMAVNLGERAQQPEQVAQGYATLGYLASVFRIGRVAETYFRKGREGAEAIGDATALTTVDLAEASVMIASGRCRAALDILVHAVARSEATTNQQTLEQSLMLTGASTYYLGDYEVSIEAERRVRRSAKSRGNVQHRVWGLLGEARCTVRLGHLQVTDELLAECADLAADEQAHLVARGLAASAALRAGDHVGAREHADALLARLGESPPKSRHVVDAIWSAGEVYAAWCAGDAGADPNPRACRRALEQTTRLLGSLSRMFPIARTKGALLQGHLAWLAGRTKAARRSWGKAAAAAAQSVMPYHEASALYWLGRLGGETEERSRAPLSEAQRILERLGCEPDARRTQAALAGL